MWPNPQLPFPFRLVTAWKISKYGVCPNTEKYGPGKIQYLDTFHAVGFLLGLFLQNPMGRTNWFEQNTVRESLHEKCPDTELFLVRIFLYSVLFLTIFFHVCLEYLYIQKRLRDYSVTACLF